MQNSFLQAPQHLDYWHQACQHLVERDRILRKIIPLYPDESMRLCISPFQALVRIIIGQQVSLKLARRQWTQLVKVCNNPILPACIVRFSVADLRALGISMRKAQYLLDAALFFNESQRMQQDWWQAMDNASVLQQLCSIKGVGSWSADMFLIFYLGRPDVLPIDDGMLLKSISRHYFSNEPVSRFEAREVAQSWAPWRTVASWYLWRSMDAAAVEY